VLEYVRRKYGERRVRADHHLRQIESKERGPRCWPRNGTELPARPIASPG
jgi:hypothetical protein